MQNDADLYELASSLTGTGHKVECFTNGSYPYSAWFIENITFMMDWKLEGSGEAKTDRPIRFRNAMHLKRTDGVKFVVKDMDDLKEALSMSVILQNEGCQAQLWIGAAWGQITEAEIVDFMKEVRPPWRLNTQVHKYIWDPLARRT
jgi:organic radical activating enzyme